MERLFEPRLAQTEAEREAIFRFRYSVYVDEMGKQPGCADHSTRTLRDEFDDDAQLYYVESGNEIIATLRLNQFVDGQFDDERVRIYRLDQWNDYPAAVLNFSSRLMVKSQYRGTTALAGLLNVAYENAREHGCRFDFCQCSLSLVEFYEQLGYRRYTDGYMDPDVGYRVPLVLMVEDNEHLQSIRSPLSRIARDFPADRTTREWFLERFPGHAVHINQRVVNTDTFWKLMQERLHNRPVDAIQLLRDVDESEAQNFLKTGTVLPVRQGETVLRSGDIGDEMFIILSGVAEVLGQKDGNSYSLALLGPGEVFGEMAFVSRTRRTAQVRAVTNVELLILTQGFLRRAMRKLPDTTAKILLNLSVALCNRLRQTTLNWVDVLHGSEDEGIEDDK